MTNSHPLAALISGVPRRYDIDPMFDYLREDLVLAALEAAPVPDLVEAAIAELQDVMRCRCSKAYTDRGMHDPDCQCDSQEALNTLIAHCTAQAAQIAGLREEALEWRDKAMDQMNRATQASQEAESAEIAVASMTEARDEWKDSAEAAEADAATLRAEVERLRGRVKALCDAVEADDGSDHHYFTISGLAKALRAALEGKA